jgi:hypothetical protein
MLKLIRNNCFETNSSSCHSITVDEFETQFINVSHYKHHEIFINPEDFGWDIKYYRGFDSKASYLAIYARDWTKHDKSTLPEDNPFFVTLTEVIKEFTGCANVDYSQLFVKNEFGNLEGDIDHQSVESNDLHYLFENKELMKNFLFSSNSYIATDNDNH